MKKYSFLLIMLSFGLSAAPVNLEFVFEDPNSTARTEGFIVFEETLLDNPGFNAIELPNPAVLDLQLTVTGSIASDGQYDINDYSLVLLGTNGGTLDFSQPLVGQATDDLPWGTSQDGLSGEFNLISMSNVTLNTNDPYNTYRGVQGGPPTGCWWFTLCEPESQLPPGKTTKGQPEGPVGISPMELQSMQRGTPPTTLPVPGLNVWSTLTLGVIFLVMAGLFRRRLN